MLVYLASPYTHPDPAVEDARYEAALAAFAQLASHGIHVFSPIVHCHPAARAHGLPGDADWWRDYNQALIAVCDAVWVLAIDGWRGSRGIAGEIELAERLGMPVRVLDPELLSDAEYVKAEDTMSAVSNAGFWEQQAWEAIQPIVDANPYVSEPQLRTLLRQAYPFAERKRWPYKVWLRCVREAIAARSRQRAWRGEHEA